ncbi:MAG: DnaJ domain-containing protein, partial [Achromobacter sp.]|nr:DnaJ domain-containing protein [Achromobacter sp.]
MEFKDYYGILGVERGASEDEIRRSYRKLARKYHPDVSKESDAEARMRDVNEAYDVLRDQEKRQAYDNLAAGVSPDGGFQPPPGWDEGFEFHRGAAPGDEAQFSEFFSSLFGGARRHAPQQDFRARGEDHHAAIEVDLDDALHGATRDISLRSMRMDDQGRPQMSTRTLSVRIPAGVREGQYIRLGGQGMPGYGGGENGDLYLEVRFKPHARYRAEGRDLYMSLPVAPWEAALGAQVEAPTPGGTVEVSIPAGSANGRKLRLRGRGIPGDPPGDLYLVLELALPPADTEAAKQAYRKMQQD